MMERKGKVRCGQWNSTYFGIYFKNFGHIPKSAIRLEKFVVTIFVCPRPKSKSIVRVCVCVYEERERASVYMCLTATRIEIFLFYFKIYYAETFTNFAPKLLAPSKKKNKQRLIVGARGRGLAKRLRAHCTHVSGHKSAITSQAGHEFHLAFCVANLSGK